MVMADSSQSSGEPKPADRRTFLKIGAGVVAGAAIATVVEVPYYNSVVGGNSNNSSSTVASLQNQLSSTQEQLSSTQDQLNSTAAQLSSAQGQVSSLNNQLSSTQAQLSSANSQLSGVNSQLTSVNSQLTATQQALTSANGQVATLSTQVSSLNSAVSSANSQATALQIQIDTTTAFQTLSVNEQTVLGAIVETFIPSDSNGPGAKEAGVLYFIDGQLAGKYGVCGHMYMKGPFIPANLTTAVTVNGVTYSAGTMPSGLDGGQRYQYNINLRDYWRAGLVAVQSYSNTAYGGNFETLSAANQVKVLQDLYNNVPTSFSNILPQDFFYEMYFMTWAGFLTDPMYGGNKGMVGWDLVAFNGTNSGNFYGEGFTPKQLMVATTPTLLKPASLGQFQKGSP
jgi:multidrug efflux pump subunit AcrA (membrane-fusion protein)